MLRDRLSSAGLPPSAVDLIADEVKTLQKLAFMSSYVPGQENEDPLMNALKEILKREPEVGGKAAFRLVFQLTSFRGIYCCIPSGSHTVFGAGTSMPQRAAAGRSRLVGHSE